MIIEKTSSSRIKIPHSLYYVEWDCIDNCLYFFDQFVDEISIPIDRVYPSTYQIKIKRTIHCDNKNYYRLNATPSNYCFDVFEVKLNYYGIKNYVIDMINNDLSYCDLSFTDSTDEALFIFHFSKIIPKD